MKTQILSLPFLENKVTRLLYFLLIPIMSLLFLILMSTQYTSKVSWTLIISSISLSGALLSMNSMVELLVTDFNLHIDREMIARNPYSLKYWGNKFIISLLSGLLLIIINLFLLVLFKAPLNLIINSIISNIFLCISATLIGQASFIISWRMSNPYFISNIVSSLAIIISGVAVPINHSPIWIQDLSFILPFARTISVATQTINYKYLIQDLLIDLIWIITMIIIYKKQIIKIRENYSN